MAFGGAMQAIHALGCERHGGVEAERGVGFVEIVIDGLRHADHAQTFLMQLARFFRCCQLHNPVSFIFLYNKTKAVEKIKSNTVRTIVAIF